MLPSCERKTTSACAADGSPIYEFTMTNSNAGVKVVIVSYGATIMEVKVPDRNGVSENVVLCHDTIDNLMSNRGPYYGAIVGRFANRIGGGKFVLDGKEHTLAQNNGCNALHGGIQGFDQKNWTAEEFGYSVASGVKFSLISPHGDEGYPGELHVDVTYTLNNSNELIIDYSAQTIGEATIVNLTNHSYCKISHVYAAPEHGPSNPSMIFFPLSQSFRWLQSKHT